MQAQEARPPFAGLWTRVEGFEREELADALRSRRIVRATLMRATLHLMSSRDYALLRAALAPAMTQAMGALGSRAKGLDVAKVLPVARALLDEEPRTFNELRALLAAEFPRVNERALGYSVRLHLPLVMVPTEDRWAYPSAARFTPADSWLAKPLSSDSAPEELVVRYLAAFGPATAADVQAWSGLKGMKPVLEGLRPRLQAFRDERGRELFDLPDAPRPEEDTPAPPRFLAEFDNLVLSHADRTRVLADEHRGVVVTKNLRVRATFLLDGFVRGTWEVERKKAAASLVITPFESLPRAAVKALVSEADALLRFLEEDASTFDVRLAV
jgi:DNA glycosylase AlkZ-like